MNESNKTRIAHLARPGNHQNTPPLVTSNKARSKRRLHHLLKDAEWRATASTTR